MLERDKIAFKCICREKKIVKCLSRKYDKIPDL